MENNVQLLDCHKNPLGIGSRVHCGGSKDVYIVEFMEVEGRKAYVTIAHEKNKQEKHRKRLMWVVCTNLIGAEYVRMPALKRIR